MSWWRRKPKLDKLALHLYHMQRLDDLIIDLSRKIVTSQGPIKHAWQQRWEEAVILYMDYEWELHPHNPLSIFRAD